MFMSIICYKKGSHFGLLVIVIIYWFFYDKLQLSIVENQQTLHKKIKNDQTKGKTECNKLEYRILYKFSESLFCLSAFRLQYF